MLTFTLSIPYWLIAWLAGTVVIFALIPVMLKNEPTAHGHAVGWFYGFWFAIFWPVMLLWIAGALAISLTRKLANWCGT